MNQEEAKAELANRLKEGFKVRATAPSGPKAIRKEKESEQTEGD